MSSIVPPLATQTLTHRSRFHSLLRNPALLLALTATLAAFAVQSGELGSSDTAHRLRATHSFWTPEPPVLPAEYPEFGIHGRGGRLYGWYGIGQSLLMLPSDILGTAIERLPIFANYNGNDPAIRSIVVSYSTNISICVLTLLVCFRFLGLLDFTVNQRMAGALGLLFCTTFLHYTQNMMENNFIMLLTLTGLTFQYAWLRTHNARALALGSCALGANLLTRLTTGLDLLAAALFIILTLWMSDVRGRELRSRLLAYAKIAVPIYLGFGLIDRIYQYARFGSFFNTYLQVYAREQKRLDPSLPASFPFENPFHAGFLGALFSPEKSIFLFDPLLLLTLILAVAAWRRFRPEIRAYLVAFPLLLLAYISFYAKYTVWSGNDAWGDRYVSTAAQLVAFMSIPLLLRHRAGVGRVVWKMGMALAAIAAVVQLSSVMFWCPLELYQMETLGHPTFVIGLRLENAVAFALGKMNRWGLTNRAMTEDAWDYAHITTWNFLPFLLKRVGEATGWVVTLLTVIWSFAIAMLIATLLHIRYFAVRNRFEIAAAPIPTCELRGAAQPRDVTGAKSR